MPSSLREGTKIVTAVNVRRPLSLQLRVLEQGVDAPVYVPPARVQPATVARGRAGDAPARRSGIWLQACHDAGITVRVQINESAMPEEGTRNVITPADPHLVPPDGRRAAGGGDHRPE
ncbi:hypothetical protein ABLU99_24615 [Klebsiella sp. JN_Kp123]|uniref:hypothetical protein n=1 Tax=Klebsiella sp. JN_Kp123 TaxID=3153436 RepID=UPI0032B4B520